MYFIVQVFLREFIDACVEVGFFCPLYRAGMHLFLKLDGEADETNGNDHGEADETNGNDHGEADETNGNDHGEADETNGNDHFTRQKAIDLL
jgi:hypothetical protein